MLTIIVTKMTTTVRYICSTNSDVTITGWYICSVISYCDNTDIAVSYICSSNSYCDNNGEVYIQC